MTTQGERTTIPRDNGEIIAVRSPTKTFLGLSEAFQLHRELALANFIIREALRKQIPSIRQDRLQRRKQTFNWWAKPSFSMVQMNHLVGSY